MVWAQWNGDTVSTSWPKTPTTTSRHTLLHKNVVPNMNSITQVSTLEPDEKGIHLLIEVVEILKVEERKRGDGALNKTAQAVVGDEKARVTLIARYRYISASAFLPLPLQTHERCFVFHDISPVRYTQQSGHERSWCFCDSSNSICASTEISP